MALDDSSLPVSAGETFELYHVESPSDLALRIPIQVVRLTMNGFGAVFKAPQPEISALLQLLEGNPQPNNQTTPSPSQPDATQWSTLIRDLADRFARERLEVVFSHILSRCVNSIQDRLHQIPSNESYQETILDTAKLQQAQKNVSRLLTNPLVEQVENNVTRSTQLAQNDGDDSELSLVDMNLFEHWLEAAKVATLLEDRFKSPLQLIEQKLLQIFPQCGAIPPALPFNPRQLTDFLNDFTEQEDLGNFARTEFFISARDILSRQLGSFYEQLDRNLPNSTAPDERNAPLPPTELAPAEPTAEADPAIDTPEAAGSDNVESIKPNDDGMTPDLAHHLAQRLTQTEGNPERKAMLQHELASLKLPQHLASRTQQRGELAGEVLASIADSNIGVAGSAHDWIQALQPSIAEAVIQNPAFMHQKTDPLRALIDELDHLGTLLPSSEQRDGEQRAALTVEALLKKTLGDPGAVPEKFASTLTHVEQLTDRMSQRYQRNVERVVATSTGRYRLKRAQRKVGEELNRRYTGRLVPKIVPGLLDNCWYALLTLDALREGEQNIGKSKPWVTLEALIQHLHGQPSQRLDPLPGPQDVFSELEKGLNDASFDPIERDNFLSDLHDLVLGESASSKDLQNFTPYDLTTPAPKKPSNQIADANWMAVLESIDDLQVGDEMLLQTDGKPPQQIRLAWKSDDGEDFALVDQRGIRALETNRQELACDFQSGRVELAKTDRRDLSKRLVKNLLSRLEDRLGKHKEHDTLTGLLNRGSFKPLLEHALTLPQGPRRPVLVWIEIEKLKMISTSLGFEAGDFILVETARLLRQIFSESDKLAYLGGDQFAALVFGSSTDLTMSLASSFCEHLSAHPMTWKETKLPICSGVGVVDMADVEGDVLHVIGLAT